VSARNRLDPMTLFLVNGLEMRVVRPLLREKNPEMPTMKMTIFLKILETSAWTEAVVEDML